MTSGKSQDSEKCSFYFKLFNNIKDESEVDLAERELSSLFGPVVPVSNFINEFVFGDFSRVAPLLQAAHEGQRLEDALTYELPYGKTQGFKGKGSLLLLPNLVKRIAYTREIYVMINRSSSFTQSKGLVSGVNLFRYEKDDLRILRVVTNQFFLEKSAYISKLSRNLDELESNLEILFGYVGNQSYRIPATETMAVGRRLEDWFAIREEPSLYLTHYMHPYKGKFHPKMARALINYVCPTETGLVLDNFSGSGTTLVEAQWLGLNSLGIDINPLSALMSQVKVQCTALDVKDLASSIEDFLSKLEKVEKEDDLSLAGQSTLFSESDGSSSTITTIRVSTLPNRVTRLIPEKQIQKVLRAYEILQRTYGKLNGSAVHEFLLLGLSGAVSDVARRTSQPFYGVLRRRLYNLWRRIYLVKKIQETFDAHLGEGGCLVGDTRNMRNLRTLGGTIKPIEDDSVDCVVNSPPYSTALDYIRNDLPQLSILNFVKDLEYLERNLIGNPNLKVYDAELERTIRERIAPFSEFPGFAQDILMRMVSSGREKDARRVLKFWIDMHETLREIRRVLKPGGKAAIVIGDNNVQLEKGTDRFEQIPNIRMTEKLAERSGLRVVEVIDREIEKSMTGMIRTESIVILSK